MSVTDRVEVEDTDRDRVTDQAAFHEMVDRARNARSATSRVGPGCTLSAHRGDARRKSASAARLARKQFFCVSEARGFDGAKTGIILKNSEGRTSMNSALRSVCWSARWKFPASVGAAIERVVLKLARWAIVRIVKLRRVNGNARGPCSNGARFRRICLETAHRTLSGAARLRGYGILADEYHNQCRCRTPLP